MYRAIETSDGIWSVYADMTEKDLDLSFEDEETANLVAKKMTEEVIRCIIVSAGQTDHDVEKIVNLLTQSRLIAYKRSTYLLMVDALHPEIFTEHRLLWTGNAVENAKLAIDLHYNQV